MVFCCFRRDFSEGLKSGESFLGQVYFFSISGGIFRSYVKIFIIPHDFSVSGYWPDRLGRARDFCDEIIWIRPKSEIF